MASYRGTAIYCTPKEAEKISGYPYKTITAYINRSEAAKIRDYFNNQETQHGVALTTLSSLLGTPFGVFGTLIGTVTGLAANAAVEMLEQRDDIFDDLLLDDGKSSWKIIIEYKYTRHGSYDGAWFLEDARVI